jgi:hypothetical protein
MNFLQKKIWIAWSKFRFLRLPVEKRVRLEVTTDGRHLTFILVSQYEAGYGVQVYGGDWFFRELMLLQKTAPIPFMYGGKETECGISITDRPSTLDSGRVRLWNARLVESEEITPPAKHIPPGSTHFLLDYDYFSGLTTKSTKERETGKIIDSKIIETTEDMEVAVGLRLASQASAEFSNLFTSQLAQDSENTSPTRSANDPSASGENSSFDLRLPLGASPCGPTSGCSSSRLPERSVVPFRDIRGQNSSSLDTGHLPLVTAPEVPLLDAGPSTLDSSAPVTSHSLLVTAPQALRAPYFMHPSVYHRGLHKRRSPSTALDARRSTLDSAAKQRRRFRLGFFGTHDREFYTKHYHFPGMDRFEILEVFFQKFGDRITHLRGFPRDWDPCQMAVSIDSRGGDRKGKSFLSQDYYFEALQECDFVLSPPGWCMPLSHNLIEAMFCGAIPITNGGAFMAEPLADGVNFLAFKNEEELVAVIERALAMDEREVGRMRSSVRNYFERFLDSKAFAEELRRSDCRRVFVNAEENSVPFVCKKFDWAPELK